MRYAVLATTLACAFCLKAQDTPKPAAQATPPSFKDVVLFQINDTEKKLTGLAQAMPDAKYSWRPAPGVRSVSELFMHEAGANVFFMTPFGVKPPAGFDPQGEKTVTEKAKVLDSLKASFAHVRDAVTAISDSDMTKTTKFMGRTLTYEEMLLIFSDHMHEHLGQAIAYARMNGVTPPWSAKSGE